MSTGTEVGTTAAPPPTAPRPATTGRSGGRPRRHASRGWLLAAAVLVAVAGRFVLASPLWLDEAQSVAIARLPVGPLLDAVRLDGSPPLYYLLLHYWTVVFGTGDLAVRSLSGLLSLAALALVVPVTRSLTGSRAAADAALVATAFSPFALRYATEARMYVLVMLLVELGVLALLALRRRPGPGPAAGLAVTTGLLLLTHYWALYLLAVTGLLLAVGAVRRRRAGDLAALAAFAAGSLLFLPWLPGFRYQVAHTGTPWAKSPSWHLVPDTLAAWGGGDNLGGSLLGLLYAGMITVALLALPPGTGGTLRLGWPPRRLPGLLGAVVVATLSLGVAAGIVASAAYASRYTAVVFPLGMVLVGLGVAALPRAARPRVLAVLAVLGVATTAVVRITPRTQAGQVATALEARARPGDVVVVCPDQLGPALARALGPTALRLLAYPTGPGGVARLDWTDYEARNKAADPVGFARATRPLAAGHAVWVVEAGGYRTFGDDCSDLLAAYLADRGSSEVVVTSQPSVGEHERLVRFPAAP